MVVDPVSNASTFGASAAEGAAKKSALDYTTFLTLLVAQLKNQDPTEPMKATEQIAQLATFSQVEQTIQTNKRLESILKASQMSQAGSLIGRTLTSFDGTISGVIEEVKVFSDGLVAVLDNGEEVVVSEGVKLK
jgi:Flagellar hook capping protein